MIMAYVKGCSFITLTDYILKKLDTGKIAIADGLKDVLPLMKLHDMVAAAKKNFVNYAGEEVKYTPSASVFALIKKIDKQKVLLGVAVAKRVPGEPTDKKGLEKLFAVSTDSCITDDIYFAEGFEAEEEYFDECMLSHYKDYVGMGQVKSADYRDKTVISSETKSFLGSPITKSAYFILMMIMWSIVFKNPGIGICFAFLFTSSFTMITAKAGAKDCSKDTSNEAGTEIAECVEGADKNIG